MIQSRTQRILCSCSLGLLIGACSGQQAGDTLIDRGVCDLLIECATSLAPEARDEYHAVYGEGGSCWAGASPMQWAACRDACRQSLDALNMVADITGESCGTCQSDADCSSYGIGAVCDAGYCVGGSPSGDETVGDGDGDGDGGDPWDEIEAVSILLVVDNSASMDGPQRTLAEGATQLVDPLDAAGIPWRLGVTTTDAGNPWCNSTGPESGRLVMMPCTDHIGDFLFNNEDFSDIACTDLCTLDDVETNPTKTASDATPKSRPWIESADGANNLAGDPSLAAALACVLPQGVAGCGFESPLDSARLALERAQDPNDNQYSFVEDGRLLVIVFVTNEVDCSDNPLFSSIFEANGGKAFWSDPSSNFPTSAVCWNAGVQCSGDPSGYDACTPADYDVDGDPVNDPDLAVLLPVPGLVDDYADARAVLTFGIVGVGADGQPHYANSDPNAQNLWGIDSGCTGTAASGPFDGLPPVRMWSVMQELGPDSGQAAYSICSPGFGGALGGIGATIASHF